MRVPPQAHRRRLPRRGARPPCSGADHDRPRNRDLRLEHDTPARRRFALTVHDATHLELAQRHSLPLATRDQALRAVAEALAIVVTG